MTRLKYYFVRVTVDIQYYFELFRIKNTLKYELKVPKSLDTSIGSLTSALCALSSCASSGVQSRWHCSHKTYMGIAHHHELLLYASLH